MEFFDKYFSYCGTSEIPTIFHRWTAISMISSLLSRDVSFPFGHGEIFPNQYVLLTGSPGTRKGSAIKVGTGLMKELGYRYFAPNRAAKEALWEWMSKQQVEGEDDEWLDDVIGEEDKSFISQAYIATDEFLDFVGIGDEGLMTNLTNLWDNLPLYHHPKTRSSSDVTVYNPTINILSGITPGGIAEAFKSLASSGGFFSRILFIYSNPNKNKIAFPQAPDINLKKDLIFHLTNIERMSGAISIPSHGQTYEFLDALYQNTPNMIDSRFSYYAQRRFTHLIKLIIAISAADLTLTPTVQHCKLANTILVAAENQMPNAIGEYGKAKHSDVSNKIVEMIAHSDRPIAPKEIWKAVARDVDKLLILQEILQNLVLSERIKKTEVNGQIYYIANLQGKIKWSTDYVDYSMLHPDEHHEDTGETPL